jgi:hypothetical protein
MESNIFVYAHYISGIVLGLTMCVWIYIALTKQYENETLKERYTQKMAKLETILNALEHNYTDQLDELKEQLFVQHEKYFTKTQELTEYNAKKFADLDRQCDLYCKFTYHVIDLQEKMKAATQLHIFPFINPMGKLDFYDVSCDTIHIGVIHIIPPNSCTHGVLSLSIGDKVFCDVEMLEKNMEFIEQFRQVKTIRIDTRRIKYQGNRQQMIPILVNTLVTLNKDVDIWFVVTTLDHNNVINQICVPSNPNLLKPIKKITIETVGKGNCGPSYDIARLREWWKNIEFVEC